MSTILLPGDAAGLGEAGRILRSGGLVAFPTETVYGLGADATNGRAVAKIYEAKGRPSFNPLIVHVEDLDTALLYGEMPEVAVRLATKFWPGPLTIVVPRRNASHPISEIVTAGLDTVALRVPVNPLARALLREAGRPLAAPSANRSGHVSATAPVHVLADLDGRIEAVIDGARSDLGVESTILSVVDGVVRLLRPGGLAREILEAELGHPLAERVDGTGRPVAPGMLASHYAPRARLRLEARDVRSGEGWLGFGGIEPPGLSGAAAVRELSATGDLREAASNLFGHLRALDAAGISVIAVAPIPAEGLGEAIRDRLSRAAAER